MFKSPKTSFPTPRGLWLLHVASDGGELQNLENGVCLEVCAEQGASGEGAPSEEALFSLCRFPGDCEQDANGEVVASGLTLDGALRLLGVLGERAGALDLKEFLEP